MYFRIDDEAEDRDRLRQLFEVTARALPLPKPKAAKMEKPARPKSKANRGAT